MHHCYGYIVLYKYVGDLKFTDIRPYYVFDMAVWVWENTPENMFHMVPCSNILY